MACPHLKQILVNIQQGLIYQGYVVFGFSEDRFGLSWRWARDLLSGVSVIIFGVLLSLIVINGC